MNKPALAKRFKVSVKTVDSWALKGCPCRRGPLGQYIFDLKAVEAWRRDNLPARKKASGGALSYSAARARKETALAGLRELQLRERTGELVEVAAVGAAAFRKARVVRDRLQNIPARCSGILAAESDQMKVFEILTREIDEALEGLVNEQDEKDPKDDPATQK